MGPQCPPRPHDCQALRERDPEVCPEEEKGGAKQDHLLLMPLNSPPWLPLLQDGAHTPAHGPPPLTLSKLTPWVLPPPVKFWGCSAAYPPGLAEPGGHLYLSPPPGDPDLVPCPGSSLRGPFCRQSAGLLLCPPSVPGPWSPGRVLEIISPHPSSSHFTRGETEPGGAQRFSREALGPWPLLLQPPRGSSMLS